MILPLAATAPTNYWPFATLLICVAFIVVAITRLKIHAFVALILAAFLAGFLTPAFSAATLARLPGSMQADAQANSWVAALELTAIEFGNAAGAIAISIGLASIIGQCLMESGGADKVVRRFLRIFGEKRAGFALLVSTYFLSIPIFFDTMFMLMVPLAKALRLRTGKSYLLYIMAICCAAVLTHSLTVPHPGPLAMVDSFRIDPGISLFWGIAAGIVPGLAGFAFIVWLDRRVEIPLRETSGTTLQELTAISERPDHELPSFFWSVAPVLLPILMIGGGSVVKVISGYPEWAAQLGGPEGFAQIYRVMAFIGNKNVALLVGTVLAMWVVARQRQASFSRMGKLIEGPVATAAVIILITSAGGAFGAMLRHAGVGEAIKGIAADYSIDLIVLGWATSFIIRVAQGSATVAMLTTASILWPMVDPSLGNALPYNLMYVYLAVGFGAFGCSWMNDSGFWVVGKLGGLTERETLRTWTLMVTVLSVSGLLFTWVASRVLPLL